MAGLTAALTLNSTDAFTTQEIALSATSSLTVNTPMSDISVMATSDDPFGHGTGVILDELDQGNYYVYIKHLGVKETDDYTGSSTTAAEAADTLIVGNGDLDAASAFMILRSGEFAFFPLEGNNDGSDDGAEIGGLKVQKGDNDEIVLEYAFFSR
jgi:hypothetical protein